MDVTGRSAKMRAASARAATAAGSANAERFTPYNTPFTMSGTMEFQTDSGTLHCAYTFTGMTGRPNSDGTATITGASMCPRVAAANLPWTFQATIRHHNGGYANGQMSFILNGVPCGSADDGFYISVGAVNWGIEVYPSCFRSGGTGTTTPALNIIRGQGGK
jgi:hypothetical protein